MFKKEDEMPKGAFGNFREVQARRRQRRRTDRQGAEVAKILVAYDRRCMHGCDRAAFGSMVVEVFPQLGPLDGEAVDAAFAECRRLARRAPEAIVDEDPHEAPALRDCLLYTSPSPRDKRQSRMPSSA